MTIRRVGIVRFPGANCEQDSVAVVRDLLQLEPVYLWYSEPDLQNVDWVILPGGFSYGDYLRSGAIARFAPILSEIQAFAQRGGPVLGICNGFQVLTEAGLLPGALVKNEGQRFVCDRHVPLVVENNHTMFTTGYTQGETIYLPVAHGDGNYVASDDTLKALEGEGQVVFRYGENINGSMNQIAGIRNARGNVLGMMPHPERNFTRVPAAHGTDVPVWTGDGARLFESVVQSALEAVG